MPPLYQSFRAFIAHSRVPHICLADECVPLSSVFADVGL